MVRKKKSKTKALPGPRRGKKRSSGSVARPRTDGYRSGIEPNEPDWSSSTTSVIDAGTDPIIAKLQILERNGCLDWNSAPLRAMRERMGDDRVREAFRNWALSEFDRLYRVARHRMTSILDSVPEGDPDGRPTSEWVWPGEKD